MGRETLLIVADSQSDANMLYAVGMFVPDPFIFLRIDGKASVVMSDLEIDRARHQARGCRVVSLSQCFHRLARTKSKRRSLARVIRLLLVDNGIRKVCVPPNFPLGLAREIEDLGIKLKVPRDGVFPEREIKSAEEVKKISAALMMAEVGLAEGIQALKSSKIAKDGRLMLRNLPLTSEALRAIIDTAIVQAGGLPRDTIVAGGTQACDPHERGHGVLRAREPIVLDVFPRSQKTGYFGDITRTVVRGRPTEQARVLYHTVQRGQAIAFDAMREGAATADVHKKVTDYFIQQGYKTGRTNGRMHGFFHGTGHGLGLDLHESPRLGSASNGHLKVGQVVTVEPGLYYPDIGGIRLEDVALVTHGRAKNLTKFEKNFET